MFRNWHRSVFHAPDEPGAGGNPPAEPGKTFAQADVDRIVQQRLASESKKTEAAIAAAKAEAAKEWEARLAEQAARLEELELKGKSAEERERIAAQKAADTIKAERESLAKQLEEQKAATQAARNELIRERTESLVGAAYDANKGFAEMRRHAIPAFMRDVEIDRDDKGGIVSIRLDGITKKDMSEAMAAWLAAPGNRGFAAATLGGGGTRAPNGGAVGGKAPSEMTSDERLRAIAAEDRAKGRR